MKASKFSSIETVTKGLTMEIDLCNRRGIGPEKLFSKQGLLSNAKILNREEVISENLLEMIDFRHQPLNFSAPNFERLEVQ